MPNSAERREWVDSILAAVDDLPETRGGRPDGVFTVTADFLPGAAGAIQKAAVARRLSPTSYVRRAALALAAHDLGIPLTDILQRDPRMARPSGYPVPDPHGDRFGPWCITGLTGGKP